MTDMIEILDRGNYSCVVANGDDVRCFSQRGVADLYHLLRTDAEFLRGSRVADKVVGKGAAALMASGGVARLYTHVISEGAQQLLERCGIDVEYGEVTHHIINRAGSDWCPVEKMCRNIDSIDDIIHLIEKFINKK